jgi:hypothetical protein
MIDILLKLRLEPLAHAYYRCLLWRRLAWWWALVAVAGALVWAASPLVPALARVGWSALVVGALAGAWWLRAQLKRRPTNYRQLAREIEAEHPDLDAALLAAVEQEPDRETRLLNYLQQRVVAESLEHQRDHVWGVRLRRRTRQACALHWAAFALGAAALWGLRPGPAGDTARRPSLALFDRGVTVVPGDTEIERGSGLLVAARFGGRVPAAADLVVTPRSGPVQRIALTKNLNDPVFGGGLPEVQGDLSYRIEWGNEQTREFTVKVFEHPRLLRADAELTFPDYTGLEPQRIEDTRRVTAVQGSKLDYAFELNKPVKVAQLVAKDLPPVDLALDTNRTSLYWAHFDLAESRQYELRLVDAEGRTNKVPPRIRIDVLPNRVPELKLAFPRGDQRVSALEEMSFQAETWDDFGVRAFGIAYSRAGEPPTFVELGRDVPAKTPRQFRYLLPLEDLAVEPDQLVTYFLWAEDVGPDGRVRRHPGDMFFAEVRPFDEIFRENPQGDAAQQQQQQNGGPQSPSERLAELQKQIISATWNVQRRESGAQPSAQYPKDVAVIEESQQRALEMAGELGGRAEDPQARSLVETVQQQMKNALDHLGQAQSKKTLAALPPALAAEQAAYQALLRLQAREYRVSRGQRGGGGGGGGQRAQRQLDQLELKQSENRYETQRDAASLRSPEQRERLQILSRLKELAQRQQDLNQRLQELQTALQEARTESEREEIRRRLQRLRDEQREMLADLDEVRQRLANAQSPETSQALQQLDQTRQQVRQAADALDQGAVSQALASGTRAQRDLQQLREDFRQQSASQFAEAMRDLRHDARQLAERQEDLNHRLDTLQDAQHKSLRDTGERAQIAQELNQQVGALTNLLTQMRQVTEQAEAAEPLLSRQLYDTLRKADQAKMDNALQAASQLLERGFTEQADQFEEKARAGITELKRGVERAAESVLGDEAEALRFARDELDALTQQLEREIARADAPPDGNTNRLGQAAGPAGELTLASAQGQRPDSPQPGGQQDPQAGGPRGQQAGQGDRPDQQANLRGSSGSRDSAENDDQQTQQASASPAQQGEPGQQPGPGQPAGRGGQGRQPADTQTAQAGERAGGGLRTGGGRTASGRSGGAGFVDQYDRGPGGPQGPLTGSDFANWSDRLGEVEELLDSPEWRAELARARDRARAIRAEFKRHSKEPQWPLVRMQILNPLVEVRQRIAEALARRQSDDTLVPIDRDPVPPKYAERVRRYYEQLSRTE